MKAFYTIILSATLFAVTGCGSLQPHSSGPSVDSRAEALLIKRHAQSIQKAMQRGDLEQAKTDAAVLKSLWHVGEAELQRRLTGLLGSKAMASLQGNRTVSLPSSMDPVGVEIKNILLEFGEDPAFKVPAGFQARVNHWIRVFTAPKNKVWFNKSLQRMQHYYPLVSKTFAYRELPQALVYMALIESGFDPDIRSPSGAVGLWQFMTPTARRYGLKVGRHLDQRKDPAKATVAAREYLLDLILEFGDGHSMLLAMAAYNAGENRIRARLRQLDDIHDRSFWTLANKNLLPAQTRDYVPKIIAAAVLARQASRYGLRSPAALASNP